MSYVISPELMDWQRRVARVVREELQPHDFAIEETGQIPSSALDSLRKMRLFGTNTPERFGGLGLSMLGSCLATEELAKAHTAYYYLSGVNVHIGSKAIELFGRPSIQDRWLPKLASGDAIGAFALTEEHSGSDAANIRTTAVKVSGGYVLNGSKTYITNAPEAGVFTVFATVRPGSGAKGITAFAVDASTPGLRIGRTIEMTAGRGSHHSEMVFENCEISQDCLLGEEGQGFAIAMRCLDAGRTHWGAYCVGVATQLLNYAIDHVSRREAFGRKLRDNQGIEWTIADMASSLHAAKLVAYDAASKYDQGDPAIRTEAAALSKYIGANMVSQISDATLQLFGGSGYSKDLPIERIWRECRVVRILDGTSEIMKQIIARHTFKNFESQRT